MNNFRDWGDLARDLRVFLIWFVSSIIDALFLSLWVCLQWLVNEYVLARFDLSWIDQWELFAYRLLLGVSTLAPIAIYIFEDTRKMVLQSRTRVQSAERRSKEVRRNG